jgi:osmoprotectant transport system ATP-binding protein
MISTEHRWEYARGSVSPRERMSAESTPEATRTSKTAPSRSASPTDASIAFEDVTYRVHSTPPDARNATVLANTPGHVEVGTTDEQEHAGLRALVRNITLTIARGETVVLLGRSGSGKTTLLRLINRMLEPSSGRVLVNGRSTIDWNPFALRRSIGYVIQEAGLFPHFTVAENIALVPQLEKWEASRITTRVTELLQLVGLRGGDFAARYPRQLSGGQRQRVGVARALAADPQILLMDEPFGALDPVTRAELQREFAALAKRLAKTIVFVTHDLREALLLATRIVLLQDGRIVACDTPDKFLKLEHDEVCAFTESLGEHVPHDPLRITSEIDGVGGPA